MKIVVFTSIYWKYDILKKQPKQTVDCEFVCFCDHTPEIEEWAEWTIIHSSTYQHLNPRMQGKYIRMHPFQHINADIYIYVDWTLRFKSDNAVEDLIWQLHGDILVFSHPERRTLDQEAQACIQQKLFYKWSLFEIQVNAYKNMWYIDNWLFATGIMIYKRNSKIENMFNERWWECLSWTEHDQLSFAYLLWKHDIAVDTIYGNLWNNKYLQFIYPHGTT
jgi:hypothetical protein